ncbi:MAG: histidine kinase [Chlorobiaceae bacterium]|nr:histidine kinase [Chlorobiaceae bacterium]NTV61126.1 histidine kinase [Chlorobiaceae bacterium]
MNKKRIQASELEALRRKAEAMLKLGLKNNLDIPESKEEMQRIVHELAVYQIELEMQQDELLQARLNLEEGLESYTDLYDFAPLAYLTLDRNGKILKANLTATTVLGVDRSSLVGDRLGMFIISEDLPGFNAMLERVFKSRDHEHCEVTLLVDGTRSFSADRSPSGRAADEQGHRVRIVAVQSGNGRECRAVLSDLHMQKQEEIVDTSLEAQIQERKTAPQRVPAGAVSDFNHNLLDKVLHSRIRFAALSYLSSVHEASFVDIRKKVSTTDGNLSVHMRILESAEYISCDKDFKARKPQTIYRITPRGKDAWINYKDRLLSFAAE